AARARGGAAGVRRLRGGDHARPLVPRPRRDPHPRLRGEQRDDLVRGLVGRLRRVDEGDARARRPRAAPDQVQAAGSRMSHLARFLGIAAIVIVVPGPDPALTVRNTIGSGRAHGVATALGVCTGLFVWTVAASAGLAAVITASQPLFDAIRIAG